MPHCGVVHRSPRNWPVPWTGAFIMAAENSRIVRRSNALQDWSWRTFRYAEQMSAGPSVVAPLKAAVSTAALSGVLGLGMRYANKLPAGMLDRILPKPGTGPSESELAGHYRIETYTTTTAVPGTEQSSPSRATPVTPRPR